MNNGPSLFKRIVRPFVNNEAETGGSGWYPELQPQTYQASPQETLEAILEVVDRRPRWELDSVSDDDSRVDFTAKTKRMGFIDDMTVRIEHGDEGSTVFARSRSREGKGDFGKNASRIQEFFDRLSTRLRVQ